MEKIHPYIQRTYPFSNNITRLEYADIPRVSFTHDIRSHCFEERDRQIIDIISRPIRCSLLTVEREEHIKMEEIRKLYINSTGKCCRKLYTRGFTSVIRITLKWVLEEQSTKTY